MARAHAIQYFAPDSRAGCRLQGSLADALAQIGEQVQEKVLRSGLHAGARVLYDELKHRAPGSLADAVYEYHDVRRSRDGRQIYIVGVNKRQAPHWFNVEYGHWRVNVVYRDATTGKIIPTQQRLPRPVWTPAHPYLRPTWDSQAGAAIDAVQRRMAERLGELTAVAS